MSKATPAEIRKAFRREVKEIKRDLLRMERINSDVSWLLERDSNCSKAAFLCEAIAVLIKRALELHGEDYADAKRTAETGKLKNFKLADHE